MTRESPSDPSDDHLASFSTWFMPLLAEIQPDLVVPVARGALRLLQLQVDTRELSRIATVATQHALPFIPDEALRTKSVLLFDDSVIWGSTLAEVREYLLRRGASVECASYVVDRHHFYGEVTPDSTSTPRPSPHAFIPLRAKYHLDPSAIRRHHSALVQALLRGGFHYNPEFPTIQFHTGPLDRVDIAQLAHGLRLSSPIREVVEVTAPHAAASGIVSYTLLLEPLPFVPFAPPAAYCRSQSKARLQYSPKAQAVLLTPIPQLSLTDGLSHADLTPGDPDLAACWADTCAPVSGTDPYFPHALFRLATAFCATVMGKALVPVVEGSLARMGLDGSPLFLADDVAAILGAANAKALERLFLGPQVAVSDGSCLRPTVIEPALPEVDDAASETLPASIRALWEVKRPYRPTPGDTVPEALTRVLLSLRAVTDTPEIRRMNPSASRLDRGLTFSSLQALVADIGSVTSDDVSVGLDVCVDAGQAVPKVVKVDGRWGRCFYSGENEDGQQLLQFRRALHEAYAKFQLSSKKTLTPFAFHKLCATLKDLHPWLPLSSRFHTFGRFSMVGSEELVDWLTQEDAGPLRREVRDGREVLTLNGAFASPAADAWTPQQARSFFTDFQLLASVFASAQSEEVLLLSTCRSHRHALSAVAIELDYWANNRDRNFGTFLAGIRHGKDGTWQLTGHGLASLYYCSRYLAEAHKKHALFHSWFDRASSRLAKAFTKLGPLGEALWNHTILRSGMLSKERDDTIDWLFEELMPILKQAQVLTRYAAAAVVELGVTEASAIAAEFTRHSVSPQDAEFRWLFEGTTRAAAQAYNIPLDDGAVPGHRSIVTTRLPETTADAAHLVQVLTAAHQELATTFAAHVPKSTNLEGELPFAPDGNRRMLADGTEERFCARTAILCMDIIGSTDTRQGPLMKDRILEMFDRFKNRRLAYDTSGNDAFVACSDDLPLLWDIATAIAVEGAQLRSPDSRFRGTRKGIAVGDVIVQRKADGRQLVKDGPTPHILPQAFGMLAAADRAQDPNEVVVAHPGVVDRIESAKFGSPCDPARVPVTAKHFAGTCGLFHLRTVRPQ